MSSWSRLLFLMLLLARQDAFAQSAPDATAETLEEVVVIGRLPGPQLWKISNGEHVLWILPLLDLYPQNMEWDTERVERIVGEAQEFITPPAIGGGLASKNPLLFPRITGLRKTMQDLPGNQTLADVLQPDLYHRFTILKERHFPKNNSIERLTVTAAASAMLKEILEQQDLTPMAWGRAKWLNGNKKMLRTKAMAGKAHVITAKELSALIATVKKMAETPAYKGIAIACFEGIVTYFERDLEAVKRHANAWALGGLNTFVDPFDERTECLDGLSGTADLPEMRNLIAEYPKLAALSPDMVELRERSRQKWLLAAELAMSRNATTFSMLPVRDIFDKTGLVAQLEARGYEVETVGLHQGSSSYN